MEGFCQRRALLRDARGRARAGRRLRDVFRTRSQALQHDERRKQLADLVGELRMRGDVLGERRPLAATIAREELIGQIIDRLVVGDGVRNTQACWLRPFPLASSKNPGIVPRISLSRRKAVT
jgi:hypothetical protein